MESHRSRSAGLSRGLVVAIALTAVTLCTAAPAEAQSAGRKFGRGLAAMTTGFLEFPGNIYAEVNAQGAQGLPLGFTKGLGMIVVRELLGVYEFVSAPFPVPSGYRPIIEPEFPWGYFE
jgi:putative exosortase-associated protein (TIGR04073 family)